MKYAKMILIDRPELRRLIVSVLLLLCTAAGAVPVAGCDGRFQYRLAYLRWDTIRYDSNGVDIPDPPDSAPICNLNGKGYKDANYPPGLPEREGWGYHDSLAYDFNGDGTTETLHIRARAELLPGRSQDDLPVMDDYAWDDGQPWQVYIEDREGERAYLYSRWIQLGRITVVTHPEGPPTVVETGSHVGKNRESRYMIHYQSPAAAAFYGAPPGR